MKLNLNLSNLFWKEIIHTIKYKSYFRKIYSIFHFSDFLMIIISKFYIFYKRKILKDFNYKSLNIEKDNGYIINDGVDKFKIYHLNKLPRYYRGSKFSWNGTMLSYGFKEFFYLEEGSTVLNVGANIGETALGFLENNLNVKAVEPDINLFNILKENKKYYEKKRKNSKVLFEIYNIALSDVKDKKKFYTRPKRNDSTLVEPTNDRKNYYKCEIINTYKIDDLFSKDKIDLIVGDVEGHEPEILMGASNTLKNCKYVALDCSDERNGEITIDETIKVLESNNFTIIRKPGSKENINFIRPIVIGRNYNIK